jgi:hypothetical protein
MMRSAMRGAALALALLAFGAAVAEAAPDPAPGKKPAAARRLEDIRIEGDVPVPQVLFVTARDPRRFLDFGHERYRKSSLDVARAVPLPTRVVMVGIGPTVTHKESAP